MKASTLETKLLPAYLWATECRCRHRCASGPPRVSYTRVQQCPGVVAQNRGLFIWTQVQVRHLSRRVRRPAYRIVASQDEPLGAQHVNQRPQQPWIERNGV